MSLSIRRRPSDRHRTAIRPVATALVWAVASVVAVPASLLAHEVGTTRVVAAIARDTYSVVLTTDASALLARLELARRQRRTNPSTPVEYQRAFDRVCSEVTHHVVVAFDDVASAPRATCRVEIDPDGQFDGLEDARGGGENPLASFDVPGVVVTLEGSVPLDASVLRWQYDLTSASYALTVVTQQPTQAQTFWLEGNEALPVALGRFAQAPSTLRVARDYLELGFTHILPNGLDHILFVLGLFLLSRHARPLIWQVSAFTLAHSITLGLTLCGLIGIPSSIVEPLIALSIVYVAIENVMTSELKPWRVALVFGFGLLHGMGFAGVLRELPLPASKLFIGLAAFNVGVEAGQATVLASAFLLLRLWRHRTEDYRRLVVVPGSAIIALAGVVWTVERLAL